MRAEELHEHTSKVRRSLPNSKVHAYKWLYTPARAVIETSRLIQQEDERLLARRSRASRRLLMGAKAWLT